MSKVHSAGGRNAVLDRISERRAVWGLSILALILRFAFIAVFYRNPRNFYDVDSYLSLGRSIMNRGEFSINPGFPSLETTPLFPLWIALLYGLFGQVPLVIMIADAFLSAATGLCFYVFARKFFSRRAALIFLSLWAVYPYSIYYCGWVYRETLMGFLAALSVGTLRKLFESGSRTWAAAGGLCAGLIGLVNPAGLIFAGLAPLGLLIHRRVKDARGPILVYILCLSAVYSPWVIRNQMTFGRPILSNITGGMNLYYGVRLTVDEIGTQADVRFRETDPVELQVGILRRQGRELEADALYRKAAFASIRRHPWRYLHSCVRRFFKFWGLVPYRMAYPYGYFLIVAASLLCDGWIVPLGLWAFWAFRRRWKELLPLYLIVFLWPVPYYLVHAQLRFRMPLMPAIVLMAAAWLDKIFSERSAVMG